MKFNSGTDTKIFALGGLGEVGKNMYCVMYNNEIVIMLTDTVYGIMAIANKKNEISINKLKCS